MTKNFDSLFKEALKLAGESLESDTKYGIIEAQISTTYALLAIAKELHSMNLKQKREESK